jgi:hypothetical protein
VAGTGCHGTIQGLGPGHADSIGGEIIAGLRRVNPEPLWPVLWPRRRGGRAEDFDPEAFAGGGSAVHVRGSRRGQLTCLGRLTAGHDVLLELPGRQHQAAQGRAGAHLMPVRYPVGAENPVTAADLASRVIELAVWLRGCLRFGHCPYPCHYE